MHQAKDGIRWMQDLSERSAIFAPLNTEYEDLLQLAVRIPLAACRSR